MRSATHLHTHDNTQKDIQKENRWLQCFMIRCNELTDAVIEPKENEERRLMCSTIHKGRSNDVSVITNNCENLML